MVGLVRDLRASIAVPPNGYGTERKISESDGTCILVPSCSVLARTYRPPETSAMAPQFGSAMLGHMHEGTTGFQVLTSDNNPWLDE